MSTKTLKFFIPGKPKGKQRPQFNSVTKEAFTPTQTLRYEDYTKWFMYTFMDKLKSFEPYKDNEPLFIKCISYVLLPKSKLKAYENSMGLLFPTIKPDFDNIEKIIADAMNKLVYPDDKQITHSMSAKFYTDDPLKEGVHVEVKSIFSMPPQLLKWFK